MPSANVEAVRHAIERGNRGDLTALRELCAADVTADAGRLWPEGAGPLTGRDAIVAIFESMISTFEQCESIPEAVVEVGDTVVISVLWRGVLAGSTSPVEQRVVGSYTFKDDEIVRMAWHDTLDDALAALDGESG